MSIHNNVWPFAQTWCSQVFEMNLLITIAIMEYVHVMSALYSEIGVINVSIVFHSPSPRTIDRYLSEHEWLLHFDPCNVINNCRQHFPIHKMGVMFWEAWCSKCLWQHSCVANLSWYQTEEEIHSLCIFFIDWNDCVAKLLSCHLYIHIILSHRCIDWFDIIV